jgi:hypothetical protein
MKALIPFLTVLLVAGLANASAQNITVSNGSFENPADGTSDYFQTNVDNSTFVPDFTFDDASSVSGTLANRFALTGETGTSDGSRVAFFNVGSGLSGTATTNLEVTTVALGENYTFTAALGNTAGTGNYSEPGTFTLNILAGTTEATAVPVATQTVNGENITDGTISDFSVTLTAAEATALSGQGLYLQVEDTDTLGNGNDSQALFDNLRLSEATPEPSTYAMLFGGLALLGFCVRRKLA